MSLSSAAFLSAEKTIFKNYMTSTCLLCFVRKHYHNLLRFMQVMCPQGLNDNVYTVWHINRLSLSTAKFPFAMLSPVCSV